MRIFHFRLQRAWRWWIARRAEIELDYQREKEIERQIELAMERERQRHQPSCIVCEAYGLDVGECDRCMGCDKI